MESYPQPLFLVDFWRALAYNTSMISTITDAMRAAKASLGIAYTEHQESSVRNLWEGAVGRHTGIYVLYRTRTLYVGLASEGNTIHNRFQPHYAKLTVDLPALYGGLNQPKKETRWQFPRNWRKGMKEEFLLNEDDIPNYWIGQQKKDYLQPANLDWRPRFRPGVDVNAIPVVIWNLNHLSSTDIDSLETLLVQSLKPPFNGAKTKQKG